MGSRKSNKKTSANKYAYVPNKTLERITEESKREEAKRLEAQKQANAKPTVQPIVEDTPVMPKYYLSNNIIDIDGHKLHQIIAARDIPELGVQEGDYGGFIESERNLSHRGLCWVFAGKVWENGFVAEGATVRGDKVQIHEYARIDGGCTVYDEANLHGHFHGTGCAKIAGRVDARDKSMVAGSAFVTDGTIMRDSAKVTGHAVVKAGALLAGNAEITGHHVAVGGTYVSGITGRFNNDDKLTGRDTMLKDTDAR